MKKFLTLAGLVSCLGSYEVSAKTPGCKYTIDISGDFKSYEIAVIEKVMRKKGYQRDDFDLNLDMVIARSSQPGSYGEYNPGFYTATSVYTVYYHGQARDVIGTKKSVFNKDIPFVSLKKVIKASIRRAINQIPECASE